MTEKARLRFAVVLAATIFAPAFHGRALAANWLIVHRDSVQTVYVDRDSIRRTPGGVNAMIKGEIKDAASNGKGVSGYESRYNFDCKGRRYRVTETAIHYTDGSDAASRMSDAPWKNTVDRVFFLYEYLCNQAR